jgi:anti-sigma regulatory factor (Ser/Thr protein kinase)
MSDLPGRSDARSNVASAEQDAPLGRGPLAPARLSWARAFPGTARQVGAARRFVVGLLPGSALCGDAAIVVSELFTNAVLHTPSGRPGGLVTVQVSRWRGGARIAVTDQGSPGAPVIRTPAAGGPPAECGNGLYLVSRLASQVSWHDDVSGRTICAVLGQPPPTAARGAGRCTRASAAMGPASQNG